MLQNVMYRGTLAEPIPPILLEAGRLSMIFEPGNAFLRHLKVGGHEVLRGVYGAVRDRNWDTVLPRITDLDIDSGEAGFKIRFLALCVRHDIHFEWHGLIEGSRDEVRFTFRGVAKTSFWRNRIGLCILHPIDGCAGQACRIEMTNGDRLDGEFPSAISPHQPFKNIRAVTHWPLDGLELTVRCEGDVFEMEDQRNWTDASFKTYSTPLELPFPARIEEGTEICQTVTVGLSGTSALPPPAQRADPKWIELVPDFSIPVRIPSLGFVIPQPIQPLTIAQAGLLGGLRPGHLRVDLKLRTADWRDVLERAADQARTLECPLHAALFFSEQSAQELDALAAGVANLPLPVSLWIILSAPGKVTSPSLASEAAARLRALLGEVQTAAGTDAYFAELNRERPPHDSAALPVFSLNPQVHAVDDLTLMENLAAQPMAVRSCRRFSGKPAALSSITLRPRCNPNATTSSTEQPAPVPSELPPDVDPRQMALFGAAWTLGSLAGLATETGVHSLTYYETTGWRGLIELQSGAPIPELFPSKPGQVFPLFHVFAFLSGWQFCSQVRSPEPLEVQALALSNPGGNRRIIAANLTAHPQDIRIRIASGHVRTKVLDESTSEMAAMEPALFAASPGVRTETIEGCLAIELLPYAVVCIDLESSRL